MAWLRALPRPHRIALLALAVSVALHAAAILGVPGRLGPAPAAPIAYSATLDAAVEVVDAPAPAAAPKPRPPKPRAKPKSPPRPEEMVAQVPDAIDPAPPEPEPPAQVAAADPEPAAEPPEILALAPVAAPPAEEKPAPDPFPTRALPGGIRITYELTSAFADGRAVYEWERDGDRYVISGEAEAVGFFTLLLEGRILQESRGVVTAEGLRPDRFVERRPNVPEEGLAFDWNDRKVTFDRKGEKNVSELKHNTVDWLSMIFQLAHKPPKGEGPYDMRVFTQRRMYEFKLRVLGVEELELPFGRVRALHLRHEDNARGETIEVWLGVDQHYVPVKLRYPVARNRVMVEQVATEIRVRPGAQ